MIITGHTLYKFVKIPGYRNRGKWLGAGNGLHQGFRWVVAGCNGRPDEGRCRKALRVTAWKFPERAGKKPATASPAARSGVVFADGFGRFPVRLIVQAPETAMIRLVFPGLPYRSVRPFAFQFFRDQSLKPLTRNVPGIEAFFGSLYPFIALMIGKLVG